MKKNADARYLGFVSWDENGRTRELSCPESHDHATHQDAQECARQAFLATGRTMARSMGSQKK